MYVKYIELHVMFHECDGSFTQSWADPDYLPLVEQSDLVCENHL